MKSPMLGELYFFVVVVCLCGVAIGVLSRFGSTAAVAEEEHMRLSGRYEIANTAEGILVLDRSTDMVYFCGPPRGVLPSEPSYRIKCIGFADLSVLVP
mgnify:CR=1 FL=1